MASGGPGRRPDAAVRLASGRQLGFADQGDPRGAPVVVLHPTPGSRRLPDTTVTRARELGIRLICAERPGFGLSEYQPGRTIADWPADVAELADMLGLARFAVTGTAAGGPYALACGRDLADRLTGVAVVAGLAPPELYRRDELMDLVRHDPGRARQVVRSQLEQLAADLPAAVASLGRQDDPDGPVLARPEVQAHLLATGREALRSGIYGMATDVWLHCTPWPFALREVTAPVRWWHGDADPHTPLATVREAVGRLPRGTLTVHPGEGHAVSVDHRDDILATAAGWT